MKAYIKKHLITIILSATGAVAGFVYWRYVGCLSGTCIIKSVWYLSTLYGFGLGLILGNLLKELIMNFKGQNKYD